MKKSITLFVLIALFLVHGAYFYEAVPLYNVIEPPDESIERALSLQVGQKGDPPPVVQETIQPNISIVNTHQILTSFIISTDYQYYTPQYRPKIFKLLSTYRL